MAYSSDEIAYIKRLGNAGATPQQIFEKIKERRQKEKDLANPRQKGFMEIAKESVVDAAVNSPAVYIPKNIYSAGKKLVHDVKGAFSDEPYQVDENSGILGKVAGTLAGWVRKYQEIEKKSPGTSFKDVVSPLLPRQFQTDKTKDLKSAGLETASELIGTGVESAFKTITSQGQRDLLGKWVTTVAGAVSSIPGAEKVMPKAKSLFEKFMPNPSDRRLAKASTEFALNFAPIPGFKYVERGAARVLRGASEAIDAGVNATLRRGTSVFEKFKPATKTPTASAIPKKDGFFSGLKTTEEEYAANLLQPTVGDTALFDDAKRGISRILTTGDTAAVKTFDDLVKMGQSESTRFYKTEVLPRLKKVKGVINDRSFIDALNGLVKVYKGEPGSKARSALDEVRALVRSYKRKKGLSAEQATRLKTMHTEANTLFSEKGRETGGFAQDSLRNVRQDMVKAIETTFKNQKLGDLGELNKAYGEMRSAITLLKEQSKRSRSYSGRQAPVGSIAKLAQKVVDLPPVRAAVDTFNTVVNRWGISLKAGKINPYEVEQRLPKIIKQTQKARTPETVQVDKPLTTDQVGQIRKLNREYFGDESVEFAELVYKNKKALGAYKDGMVTILNKQSNPIDTLNHEAVHKYLDVFATSKEKDELWKYAASKYGIDDLAKLEEKIAEDFIGFVNGRKTVVGKMADFFSRIINRIKKYMGNDDKIQTLYEDIIAGKGKKNNVSRINSSHAKSLIEAAKKHGGGTLNLDGSLKANEGDFIVSIRSRNVDGDILTPEDVLKFVEENKTILKEFGDRVKVGLFEMGDGNFSIDVNLSMKSKQKALEIAKMGKQKAIYDETSGSSPTTGFDGNKAVDLTPEQIRKAIGAPVKFQGEKGRPRFREIDKEIQKKNRQLAEQLKGKNFDEEQLTKISKVFNEDNADIARLADAYAKKTGKWPLKNNVVFELDEAKAKKIADHFDNAKDLPEDPKVVKSYTALAKETKAQYDFLTKNGYQVDPWLKEGQPYKTSQEMVADVKNNKHLYFFLTDEGFGNGTSNRHPLLQDSGIVTAGKKLKYNDLFRAVHDLFGHAKIGNQFGALGEENAWRLHSQMFSDEARKAMTMETRGQNSWVNFWKHLRDSSGNIPKKGEPGYVSPADRKYADQKTNVMPQKFVKFREAVTNAYNGEKEFTLKTLEKLKGRETVSKEYILNLTNSGDIKQAERDLIRKELERGVWGDKIPVKSFADVVLMDVLPLKVKGSDLYKPSKKSYNDGSEMVEEGSFSPMYEGISLPSEMRGKVANYNEKIYESPIKTSGANAHFQYTSDNYFGHSRIENMADGKTRRVIELQSDLFQKGNLEKEMPTRNDLNLTPNNAAIAPLLWEDGDKFLKIFEKIKEKKATAKEEDWYYTTRAEWTDLAREAARIKVQPRIDEVSKLEPYRNTFWERMIREEIKTAGKDEITKLQFPTGETAMKIEGLGDTKAFFSLDPNSWMFRVQMNQGNLEVGQIFRRVWDNFDSIVTDVLWDGKFKAVQKRLVNNRTVKVFDWNGHLMQDASYTPERVVQLSSEWKYPVTITKEQENAGWIVKDEPYSAETFDISGKVDTSNPIYKFYEKDVSKYIQKLGGKRVTDNKWVEWMELPITKENADAPVAVFRTKAQEANTIKQADIKAWNYHLKDVYRKYSNTFLKEIYEKYDLKKGSPRAVVIDPDGIKKMFQEYDALDPGGVHEESSTLAKEFLASILKNHKGKGIVFSAGGPASGKSEAVVSRYMDKDVIVYDHLLRDFSDFLKKFRQAESNGKKVIVHAVYTDIETAKLYNQKRGREVPDIELKHAGFRTAMYNLINSDEFKSGKIKLRLTKNHGWKVDQIPKENMVEFITKHKDTLDILPK